jgi:hypothetical protein
MRNASMGHHPPMGRDVVRLDLDPGDAALLDVSVFNQMNGVAG